MANVPFKQIKSWIERAKMRRISDLLGELTGLVGRVGNLVKEDGEVEGEAEADRMGRLHLILGDVERRLVRFLRLAHHACNTGRFSGSGPSNESIR